MMRALRLSSTAKSASRISGVNVGPLKTYLRTFHGSAPILNNSSDPAKSPFQVFVDTFRSEWKKSSELQENIKALQDETGRMSESGAYKKAKEAYEKAKSGTSSASSATGETLKKAGKVVGSAAAQAWDSSLMKSTRTAVNKTADSVDKATEPIRRTEFYQDVKKVIDDGSSIRYGGFEERETRRRRRSEEEKKRLEEELKSGIRQRPVQENTNSGQHVILHETAKSQPSWKDSWTTFTTKSAAGKRLSDLKMQYEESENGVISSIRAVADRVGTLFSETESARVIRAFKGMDPAFNQERFLKEVREYILPEILDAYVKGDADILKHWLSEAPFNIWAASAKQYQEAGLYSAGRVLDIRGVDVINAKILPPAEIPVFIIGCRAQEVHLYRNVKNDEIAAGMEDHIQLSTYAMVITRIPEEIEDPETKGWKILELVRAQTREWT